MPHIPFSFFVSLLKDIAFLTPRPRGHPVQPTTALHVFASWTKELRRRYSPLPAGTTAIVFRLLFPEDERKRVYELGNTRLMELLCSCVGGQLLSALSSVEAQSIGKAIEITLSRTSDVTEGPLSIFDVDKLLNELASLSMFSHHSIYSRSPALRRSRKDILYSLFHTMPPIDAAFLSQIILKDLRPLLYPAPDVNYSNALLKFNSNSVQRLEKREAFDIWDHSRGFHQSLRLVSDLDIAGNAFDTGISLRSPIVGQPVQVPQSRKGLNCRHALQQLNSNQLAWCEIKYDGERAQIHVEFIHGEPKITIYSKSTRDSTWDRHQLHDIILRSLRLTKGSTSSNVNLNVILDAEMVAFHGNEIDEFWRIRHLVESTAVGARRSWRSSNTPLHNWHLGLVFFDILYLDAVSLMNENYAARRIVLEKTVETIPGLVQLASRQPITLSEGIDAAASRLQQTFSEVVNAHQEGIILKGDDSCYNDLRQPWVKLKRDYIPGHGDCVDLVILGASNDPVRSSELKAPKTTFTTFFVGCLQERHQASPHFEVYFTVSYGLSREQLEDLNFRIKNSNPVPFSRTMGSDQELCFLKYTYTISKILPTPEVLFREPILVELFGAGFTKSPPENFYELRFPRISKVYRRGDRSWRDCISLNDFEKLALDAVGQTQDLAGVEDWCNHVWARTAAHGDNYGNEELEYRQQIVVTTSNAQKRSSEHVDSSAKRQKCTDDARKAETQLLALSNISKTVPLVDPIRDGHHDRKRCAEVRGAASWRPGECLEGVVFWLPPGLLKSVSGYCNSLLSKERQLHSLESLIFACSCREQEWVRGGIVFVQRDERKEIVEHDVLQQLGVHVGRDKSYGLRKPVYLANWQSFDRWGKLEILTCISARDTDDLAS